MQLRQAHSAGGTNPSGIRAKNQNYCINLLLSVKLQIKNSRTISKPGLLFSVKIRKFNGPAAESEA